MEGEGIAKISGTAKKSVNIMNMFFFIPIIVLILLTISHISAQAVFSSAELKVVKENNITSFVDENGKIRMAADKGYASVNKIYEDGKVVLEQYLDERGKSVTIPAGYSQISRLYGTDSNTEILYLDIDGSPIVTKNGYDTIRRSYNKEGLADTDTYWIGYTQVERKQGYWGYQRVYDDEGRICEIRYLDQNGNLTITTSGYARILRFYENDATIDMYYDQNSNAVSLSLGQYGKRTEKIDGVNITTYLDENGLAKNTSRGYAIVEKEGSRTLYYDNNHNPVTLGRNQYGIEKANGQNVYLNEDGEQMIRVDNVLNTRPYLVLIFGILMTIVAIVVHGRGKILFTILYLIFIGIMTIAYREAGNNRAVFELFKSYKEFLASYMVRQNILNNIWLFIPLGAALYGPKHSLNHRFRWIWAVALSIVIETVQYFTGIGVCELDDVFSNGLGALIGYMTAYGCGRLYLTLQEQNIALTSS